MRHVFTAGLSALLLASALPASAQTAPIGGKYKIALILGTTTDNFYTSMQCGAVEAARKLGDVELTVQGAPRWDATLQTPVVNAVTASGVQAIAIAVNDGRALYAPLKAASDKGIKILGVDTRLADSSFVVTNISSDNRALGAEAARTLAKLMGEKGTALIPPITPGITTVADRIQGFIDEMKAKHKNIKIVYKGISEDASAFSAAFAANPDITGMFLIANNEALVAAGAIRQLPAERRDKISVVSFDAAPALVDALKANQIQAIVAQKPAQMGALAVQMARKALMGQPVAKSIPTGGVGLTASNIGLPAYSQYVYKSTCK
ncbi:ribose transport system substrate-binding protein [Deinococcus metalli]|uniref:Ribose transport system substrate-binding protein n=1 Tax=Deinococcus metalli TaxID=1141878 RepID=A0A7W8NP53_9DEIO|nr:ABC transporter substrate-binding protein [Deinococcus metalli]MBB5376446.1 ribose transport system substrate-binding protein [Deinococcus metalli]GHF43976.1 sugar ABC transporter substrate-binding protein [Deinococcus metalli]